MSPDVTEQRVDKVALRKALGERLVGSRLLYFLSLPSTNDHARELAEDGWPEGTIVLAEEQVAGKGRAGRSWHSPAGVGLYFSVILKPELPAARVPLVTLMTAVAVTRALREKGFAAAIKWPNDILIGGKKVAGILADTRMRPHAPPEVVVGTGLNVNHTDEQFPADLAGRAGSLRQASGREQDRTEILTAILIRLDEAYASLQGGREGELIDAFLELCPMARGATVTVSGAGRLWSGTTQGIGPAGSLRISTPEGSREVHAGDVSITESTDASGS